MKKLQKSPVVTAFLFMLSVVLLFVGGIGGAQAALTYESGEYTTELMLRNIGVMLLESTKSDASEAKQVSYRYYGTKEANGLWYEQTGNLVEDMVKDANDTGLKLGKEYPFFLTVENPLGDYDKENTASRAPINTYVRVTLYKYWVDSEEEVNKFGWYNGEGTKNVDYDPNLIKVIPSGNSDWTLRDETDERMVFYYNSILTPGQTTSPLTKGIIIDPSIADLVLKKVTTVEVEGETKTITEYEYVYDGVRFVVEAQVDAVQAKHSDNSVPSAWGVDYIG